MARFHLFFYKCVQNCAERVSALRLRHLYAERKLPLDVSGDVANEAARRQQRLGMNVLQWTPLVLAEDRTHSETSDEPQFFRIAVKAENSQFVFRSVNFRGSSFHSLFYPPL